MSKPHDEGWAFCDAQPDLLAAAVWQEASKFYQDRDEQREFVNGYINRRRQIDEHRREQSDESSPD